MAPEPDGPLTPDERERGRQLLTAQQFVVYKNHRDKMTVTLNAQRAGIARARVRHIICEAQTAFGYEPTYAPKHRSPGKYVSVAEQRTARGQEFRVLIAALDDENPAEVNMLFESQPAKPNREMSERLALAGSDDERFAIMAEYLYGPALERLRKLGRWVSRPQTYDEFEDDLSEAARHRHDEAEREAVILEELGGQGHVPESAGST